MSSPLSPVAVGRCFCTAFAADKNLSRWARERFGKDMAIMLGTDMNRPPESNKAPFLVVFPDSGVSGPQKSVASCDLGLVAGILEGEETARDGFSELRGLTLMEELFPLLEGAMRNALPRARLQNVEAEYDIYSLPLCQLMITVTVEQGRPIGGP